MERQLSLAAVGALFGVSHAMVSRWERGQEPDADGIVRGKPIPRELVPFMTRWLQTGEAPSAEELAARTTARAGVNRLTGKPQKPVTV